MSIIDYFKGPEHKARAEQLALELADGHAAYAELNERYDKLRELAKKYGALGILEVERLIGIEQVNLIQLRANVEALQREATSEMDKVRALQSRVVVLEETLLLESFALYIPKFDMVSSLDYKARLEAIRAKQKAEVKSGDAARGGSNWTVNGNVAEGKRMVSDMIKLLVRSFNNECDYCVDNVKFDNVELGEKRIRQSFDAINKLGRVMSAAISDSYLRLKLDELYLAYEFQLKKQEEKEAAKKAREELREQQKLEQEIRAAREKIAKERRHFVAAIREVESRIDKAATDEDREALRARLLEMEAGKAALDGEEKLIDYREKNAKAGYVYVISNLGAFGEGVYKIGMTRRLEPMDRVDELGDASVPFEFDVHALVFSDNAPALEAKLHEHFTKTRINKVNGRKEFFRADIGEIENVIRANYDKVVEVVHEANAEQYRESLRM